jgi:hypothetical protein
MRGDAYTTNGQWKQGHRESPPQVIIRWPNGLERSPVFYLLTGSAEMDAELETRLRRLVVEGWRRWVHFRRR